MPAVNCFSAGALRRFDELCLENRGEELTGQKFDTLLAEKATLRHQEK